MDDERFGTGRGLLRKQSIIPVSDHAFIPRKQQEEGVEELRQEGKKGEREGREWKGKVGA